MIVQVIQFMFYSFQIMKGRGFVDQHRATAHRAFVGHTVKLGASQEKVISIDCIISQLCFILLLLGPTHIYFWVPLLDLYRTTSMQLVDGVPKSIKLPTS